MSASLILDGKNRKPAPVHDDEIRPLAVDGTKSQILIHGVPVSLRPQHLAKAGLRHHAMPRPQLPNHGFQDQQHAKLAFVQQRLPFKLNRRHKHKLLIDI